MYYWKCLCTCGAIRNVARRSLNSGRSQSCGCLNHNPYAGTKVLRTFRSMHNRCENISQDNFKYYGGRGIKVSERWNDFKNFLEDMGEPPSSTHSIDRINPDGNYEPSNCRWGTKNQQANNMRIHKYLYGTKLAKLTGYSQERVWQLTFKTSVLEPYIQEKLPYGNGKEYVVYKNEAINFLKARRNN